MLFHPESDTSDVQYFAAVATQWEILYPGALRTQNLRNIATTGLIVAALGLVMTLINAAQGQYVMALTCFFILLAGAMSHVFAARFRNREAAVVSAADKIAAVEDFIDGYKEKRPGLGGVVRVLADRRKESTEWITKKE